MNFIEYVLPSWSNYYLKRYSTGDSSISNVSDETKREEIKEETHELEDTEQDELEEDDDYEDEGTE